MAPSSVPGPVHRTAQDALPAPRNTSCPPPADTATLRAATGQPDSGGLSPAMSPPRRYSSSRHQEKQVPTGGTLGVLGPLGGPEQIKSRRHSPERGLLPAPRRMPSHLRCCLEGLLETRLESGGWCSGGASSASDPSAPHLLRPGRPPATQVFVTPAL